MRSRSRKADLRRSRVAAVEALSAACGLDERARCWKREDLVVLERSNGEDLEAETVVAVEGVKILEVVEGEVFSSVGEMLENAG